MKTAVRLVITLGVLGGIAWLLYRFGPKMVDRCQSMMEEPGETFGDEVADAIEEELREAQV
jgi:hypothetical protein